MLEYVVIKVRFILFVVVMVVFAGRVATGQEPVAGTVTDAHGDAIAGAVVRCGESVVTTDRSGNFTFSACRWRDRCNGRWI